MKDLRDLKDLTIHDVKPRARALSRPKLDGVAPQTQHVNLRKVGGRLNRAGIYDDDDWTELDFISHNVLIRWF
jgi:hypothetical protein